MDCQTMDLIEGLLNEVMSNHCDPDSESYNECEKEGEQCQWCADAEKSIELMRCE